MLSDKEFFEMDERMKALDKDQPPIPDFIEQLYVNYPSDPPDDFYDKLIDERMSKLTKVDLDNAVEVFKLLIKWRAEEKLKVKKQLK